MPTIYRNEKLGRFEAISEYADRLIFKDARWLWDANARVWWTKIPENAFKLADYAAPDLRDELLRARVALQETIASSSAADSDAVLPVPEGLQYLPYQRAGIAAMSERTSVLLGDEMGLGKTVQAIGVINTDPTIERVLIVCPATLKTNWQRELERWSTRPHMSIIGSGREPKFLVRDAMHTDRWGLRVLILNYDLLASWRRELELVDWDLIIADEAHYLKTPHSARTVALCGTERPKAGKAAVTPLQARRRLFLSGTPILNKPVELWPLLHYLDPVAWPRFWTFAQRYCGAYQDEWGWHFDGASNLDELNTRLRSSVMIRRLKADVLTDLPPKVRMIVEVDPNGASKLLEKERTEYEQDKREIMALREARDAAKAQGDKAYKDAVKALTDRTNVSFQRMSSVRRQVALSKVPRVAEHVEMLLQSVNKVLIWAHHHDVIDALREALSAYDVVVIDGRTPAHKRMSYADDFQFGPAHVMVGGISSAGTGLTLTACSTEVFAELDWVPANMMQAEDRCHRIGQTDSVLVQHVLYNGSLDVRMAKRLLAKQAVIDRALDADGGEPIDLFDLD